MSTLPGSGEGSGSSKGGKGISGREGAGCGDLGCKGEEKDSLGYLDPRASVPNLSPGPLLKFSNFPRKPPGIYFLILGHRYLNLNFGLLGDPGVRAPNNSFRTFDQIRAKLLLLLCPPPPFPSSLLLFLKESYEHPKAPYSTPLRISFWRSLFPVFAVPLKRDLSLQKNMSSFSVVILWI